MNAKQSMVWFVVGIVWLAGVIASAAYGASVVGENLQSGLIWLGVAIVVGVAGVFGGVKLNKKR